MPSRRLVASYVFDWVCIIALAAIGAAFNSPGPYHRPFSLVDLSISYPYVDAVIPTWLLVVVSILAPAAIILVVAFAFVPGPTATRETPRALLWRRKFWEWNTGWMGLGLSVAVSFFFTQGLKNLFGKPRPDLLARCKPDVDNIAGHAVGTYASSFSPEWVLVSYTICQQTDKSILDDGFRSFPSGHSSMSWSGLLYLALFLCSKFAVTIPFLSPRPFSNDSAWTAVEGERREDAILPLHNKNPSSTADDAHANIQDLARQPGSNVSPIVPIRNQAAAPPTYLLALPLVPICVAFYICASRFFQFYHHGFDIVSGALIGILSAWFGFRWYHLPISQGAGWSWGARSRDRAWGIGVGAGSYVGTEGWGPKKSDVAPTNVNGHGSSTQRHDILGAGLSGPQEGTDDVRDAAPRVR
jgi:membrane-associated phospholipid phosphatase